jgi:arylsulfatase
MEIYAGMIDFMDESIGRVLQHLKNKGEYDNTLVVFISDNGPSKTSIADYVALGGKAADFFHSFDNSLENKGRPGSSTDIGPGWAYASATPLRLFKGYVTQGGIQVPAIIKTPKSLGRPSKALAIPIHVLDLAPTFLELAGSTYPASYRGVSVPPLQGESLLPLLLGSESSFARRGLGWEAYGMDAWIEGNWKLVRLPKPYGNDRWQLYDLNQDPGEINDLAALKPGLTASLAEKWRDYAITNEVVHPDSPVAYAKTPRPGRY